MRPTSLCVFMYGGAVVGAAVGAAVGAVDAIGSGDDVGEKVAVGRGDGASLVFAMRAAVGVTVGHVVVSVKTLR